jgi:two-component system, chemotaxis family, chemotaxis protein CheY
MTVLVVDDDADTRELIRRVLMKEFELRIVEASDGRIALERLAATRIDVMLLDIRMPGMSGLQVLETVRHMPGHKNLRVVMLTGMADEDEVRTAMRMGVCGVLVKPLTPTLLRERLSRLFTEVQAALKRQGAGTNGGNGNAIRTEGARTEATLMRQLFDSESPSVNGLLDTACKLIGEPLHLSMTVRPVQPQMTPTVTARWIFGSVHLHGAQGSYELCVHLPFTVALRLGSASHQTTPDRLSVADVRDVVLNLALELGTMMRDDGMKSGLRMRVASGRSGEQPAGALFRTLQCGPGMARCLLGVHDQPAGAIQLIAHTAAATAV